MQDGEGVAHAVGFRAVEHLEAVVLVEADGLAVLLVYIHEGGAVLAYGRHTALNSCSGENGGPTSVEVLIEGTTRRKDFPFWGRTRFQAPEIDGVTHVRAGTFSPGDIVRCRITGAALYDLHAQKADD